MSLLSEFKQAVANFRNKANEFMLSINNMEQQRNFVATRPELKKEYDDLMDRTGIIKSTVSGITSAINKAAQWFGVDFDEPQNLGLVPLIPIAAIAASVAVMGKWVSDAYIFNQRIAEVKRLEAKGIPPERAAKIALKMPPSMLQQLGENVIKPVFGLALLGLGFWAYNIYQKRYR